MSKKEKRKNPVAQENKESLKQHEPEAVYEMGYRKGQRLRGFLEVLVGVLLLCLSLWLWSRTWGIKLLFTDAAIGRLVRYYWIVLIIAVVILIVGFVTMRKVRIEKKHEVAKKEDGDNSLAKHETAKGKDDTLVKRETAKGEDETLILSDTTVIEDKEDQNAPEMERQTVPNVENQNLPEMKRQTVPNAEYQSVPDMVRQVASDGEKADGLDQTAVISEEKKTEIPSPKTSKMSDNKCPSCGKDKKTGAAFCIYCGYKF